MRACAHGWKPKGKNMCPSKKTARKLSKEANGSKTSRYIDVYKDGDVYTFVRRGGKVLLKTNGDRVEEWATYFHSKSRGRNRITRQYDTTLPAFKEFHKKNWKRRRSQMPGFASTYKGSSTSFSNKSGAFRNK